MRKRQSTLVTAVIVIGIALVALGSDRASGQGDVHVFMPVGTERSSSIDVVRGPGGFDLGDGVAVRAPLVDPASGENAGSVYFECTVMRKIVSPDQGLWRCSYHLRLADGAIILQGLDPRGVGASTFAVLGGTNAYRSASGDAVFTDSVDGTDIVITLT
jgi:hypothetical protein